MTDTSWCLKGPISSFQPCQLWYKLTSSTFNRSGNSLLKGTRTLIRHFYRDDMHTNAQASCVAVWVWTESRRDSTPPPTGNSNSFTAISPTTTESCFNYKLQLLGSSLPEGKDGDGFPSFPSFKQCQPATNTSVTS